MSDSGTRPEWAPAGSAGVSRVVTVFVVVVGLAVVGAAGAVAADAGGTVNATDRADAVATQSGGPTFVADDSGGGGGGSATTGEPGDGSDGATEGNETGDGGNDTVSAAFHQDAELISCGEVPDGGVCDDLQDEFDDGDDRLATLLTLDGYDGTYDVEIEWYAPDGDREGYSEFEDTSDIAFWSWFEEDAIDDFAAGDPGEWEVEAYVDGERVATTTFTVDGGAAFEYDEVETCSSVDGDGNCVSEDTFGTDEEPHVLVRLDEVTEDLDVEMEWHTPDGDLYDTVTHDFDGPSAGVLDDAWIWTAQDFEDVDVGDETGEWSVEVYVDDERVTTTEFELTGDSDGGPNLEVVDVELDPSNPDRGERVDFCIEVKNTGTETAGEFETEAYVDDDLAAVPVDPNSLEPGESAELPCTGNNEFEGGTHTVTAEVDVNDQVDETDENDNTESVTFQVDGEVPTGTVTGEVTDEDGDPIEAAKVYLDAGNRETRTDEDGDFVFDDVRTGEHTIDVAAAGHDESDAQRTITVEEGETVTVDYDLPAEGPNLEVVDVETKPKDPTAGEDVEFCIEVENTGTETAGEFETEAYVDGELVAVPVDPNSLDPGESAELPCTGSEEFDGGTYTVTAEVDVNDQVDETDEGDNTAATEFTVDTTYGSISGTVTDPSGDPVEAAKVYLDDGEREVRTDDNGEFNFETVPVGDHTVDVAAAGYDDSDAQQTVNVDEGDTSKLSITLPATGVAVSVETITTTDGDGDGSYRVGESVTLRSTVRNDGQGVRTRAVYEVDTDGDGKPETIDTDGDGTAETTEIVDNLGEVTTGDEADTRATFTPTTAGESRVRVRVDARQGGQWKTVDQTGWTPTLDVSKRSVSATIRETTFPSGTFGPGSDVSVTTTVENTGNAEATFYVGYTADHTDTDAAYDVPAEEVVLAPGERREVTLTWTVPELPPAGEFELTTAVWLDSTDEGLVGRQDSRSSTVTVEGPESMRIVGFDPQTGEETTRRVEITDETFPFASSSLPAGVTEANFSGPPEERERIVDTDTYPWSAVGQVSSGCSGVLVEENHVLTAAHCVYTDSGEFYETMFFTPGKDKGQTPFGASKVTYVQTFESYPETEVSADYDIAVLTLNREVGRETGTFGYGGDDGSGAQRFVPDARLTGYPSHRAADYPGRGEQWDIFAGEAQNFLGSTSGCSTPACILYGTGSLLGESAVSGTSGGPLWHRADDRPRVLAVHSGYRGKGLADQIELYRYSVGSHITDRKQLVIGEMIERGNRVDLPPRASVTASADTIRAGQTVTLDARGSTHPDGEVEQYVWDTNDDGTFDRRTSDPQIQVSFDVAGEQSVTLKLVGSDDRSDTAVVTVEVLESADDPSPAVDATLDAPTSVEVGQTVTLDATETSAPDGATYRFDVDGDGAVEQATSEPSVTHTYTESGEYTPTVTVVYDGRQSTDSVTVTVAANQPPAVEIDAPETATAGERVAVDAEVIDPDGDDDAVTVDWAVTALDGGDAPAPGDAGVTRLTFDEPGEYEVTVTATDADGANDTATHTITVEPGDDGDSNEPPTVELDAPAEADVGATVRFDAEATDPDGDDAALAFEWSVQRRFGAAPPEPGTGAATRLTFDEAGGYEVTVTVTDADGATATATTDITVARAGGPAVTIRTRGEFVVGESTTLEAFSGDRGVMEFDWRIVDTETGETVLTEQTANPRVDWTPAEPRRYRVKVTATNAREATGTDTTTVTVSEPGNGSTPPPQAAPEADSETVAVGGRVTLDANATDGDADGDLRYEWTQVAGPTAELTDADTATPTVTAPQVSQRQTLRYRVTVTDGDTGATATGTVAVTVTPSADGAPYTATRRVDGPVTPGETATVTVAVDVNESVDGLALNATPGGGTLSRNASTPAATFRPGAAQWLWLSAEQGTYTVTYDVRVPDDAERGTTIPLSGTVSASELPSVTVEGDDAIRVRACPAAVAAGDDRQFTLEEIQRVVGAWADDEPVGGEVLDLRTIQRFVGAWADDERVTCEGGR